MNNVFRLIWNRTLGRLVVTSEAARSCDKAATQHGVVGQLPAPEPAVPSVSTLLRPAVIAVALAAGSMVLITPAFANGMVGGGLDCASGDIPTVSGIDPIAIGCGSSALGDHTTAVGVRAEAIGGQATALGNGAKATNEKATALGNASVASGQFSTAVGTQAKASGYASFATGLNSAATGSESIAIGYEGKAEGNSSVAVGSSASASTERSVAIGYEASVTGTGKSGIAIGENAQSRLGGAIAIGENAYAESTIGAGGVPMVSVALGFDSRAVGQDAGAFGTKATAEADYATALGNYANASKRNAIAAGNSANASGVGASAFGNFSNASGYNATALGGGGEVGSFQGAQATADGAVAVGGNRVNGAQASADDAIAIGGESKAQGAVSIALGKESDANGDSAIAIGMGSYAWTLPSGDPLYGAYSSVALGDYAIANASQTTALGSRAWAEGAQSTAIGNDTLAYGGSSVAIGGDDLFIYNADGSFADNTDNEFIEFITDQDWRYQTGPNDSALDSVGDDSGYVRAQARGHGSNVIGTSSMAYGDGATVVGSASLAEGDYSSVLGAMNVATGEKAVAVGNRVSATGKESIAIGSGSLASMTDAIAMGTTAKATGVDSIAIGKDAWAAGSQAFGTGTRAANGGSAFGDGAQATWRADNDASKAPETFTDAGAAFGENALANQSGATALGTSASVTVADGVALGAGSVASRDAGTNTGVTGYDVSTGAAAAGGTAIANTQSTLGAVSVAADGDFRQITHVAAGSEDSDAVNVAQLKAVRDIADAGSSWVIQANSDTADTVAPDETVQFIDGKNIDITRDSDQVIRVATEDEVEFTQVTIGDATNNTVITSTVDGLDVGGDNITNVAPGEISDTSMDAVNGSQLNDTNTNVTNNAGDIANNTTNITNNTDAINDGINFGDGTTANNYALGDTINVKGDANVTSTTTADGVQLGLADVVNVGSTNSVTIDGDAGTIGGLTNKTFDPNNFTSGQAASEDQLSQVTTDLTTNGLNFAGNEGLDVHRDLGQTLAIQGEATSGGTYTGANLKTVTDPATGAINLQMTDSPDFTNVNVTNQLDVAGDTNIGGNTTIQGDTIVKGDTYLGDSFEIVNNEAFYDGPINQGDSIVNKDYVDGTATHYYSVQDDDTPEGNYNNDGATGWKSMAAGTNAIATKDHALAVGDGAQAIGFEAMAIGREAVASGPNSSIAIGQLATATQDFAISIGRSSEATAENAVALGNGALARADKGVALGSGSLATRESGVLGYVPGGVTGDEADAILDTVANRGAVSVGGAGNTTRQITNVAAGTEDRDAVNVAQLKSVSSLASQGWDVKVNGEAADNVAPGEEVQFKDGKNIAITRESDQVIKVATADDVEFTNVDITNDLNVAGDTYLGDNFSVVNNEAFYDGPINQGDSIVNKDYVDGKETHYYSVNDDVKGPQGNYDNLGATGINALAAGTNAQAAGASSTAVGDGARTGFNANNQVAVGSSALAGGQASIAIGNNAKASTNGTFDAAPGGQRTVALGDGANAQGNDNVAVGSGSLADGLTLGTAAYQPVDVDGNPIAVAAPTADSEFSVGDTGSERRVTNVAAGAEDTDAVNVSQLKAVNDVASAGWNVQTNGDAATNVAPNATVQFIDGKNIDITRTGTDITVATADNVDFTNVNVSNQLDVAGDTNIGGNTTIAGNTTIDGDTTVKGDTFLGDNFKVVNNEAYYSGPITDGDHITNKTYVDGEVDGLANTPITFAGDTGTTDRKLGDELNIVTSNANLSTEVTDDETLVIALSDDLDVNSVATNTLNVANNATIGGALNVTGQTTLNGGLDMAGNKITNVAPGTDGTDAVNVDQLTDVSDVA
ncbi:ESPR-type extended signal peptide-containing protein, partial [Vreelandella alkaliphila]